MVNPRAFPEAAPILQLLTAYSFDTEDTYQTQVTVIGWLQQFEATWINQAITEALYQGRYKLVSVDHILRLWRRRGQPLRHYNREFESIILGSGLGRALGTSLGSPPPALPSQPVASRSRAIPPLSGDRLTQLQTQRPTPAAINRRPPVPQSSPSPAPQPAWLPEPSSPSHTPPRHLATGHNLPEELPETGFSQAPDEALDEALDEAPDEVSYRVRLDAGTQSKLGNGVEDGDRDVLGEDDSRLDHQAEDGLAEDGLAEDGLAKDGLAGEDDPGEEELGREDPSEGSIHRHDGPDAIASEDKSATATDLFAPEPIAPEPIAPEPMADNQVALSTPESASEPALDDSDTDRPALAAMTSQFRPVSPTTRSQPDSIPPFVPQPVPSGLNQRLQAVVRAGQDSA